LVQMERSERRVAAVVERHKRRTGGHLVSSATLQKKIQGLVRGGGAAAPHHQVVVIQPEALELLAQVCDGFLEKLARDVAEHKALAVTQCVQSDKELRLNARNVVETLQKLPAYHLLCPSSACLTDTDTMLLEPAQHQPQKHKAKPKMITMSEAFLQESNNT